MVDQKDVSTKVTIFGETYYVRSQAKPDYTQQVADHVNQVMFSIKKNVGLQEPHKIAILAAMTITDELFQVKRDSDLKQGEVDARCRSLIHLIETYLEKTKSEEVLT